MSFYTERNGLRKTVKKTENITTDIYGLLFDCCKKYYDNIAWKYPEECPDGNYCCGLDLQMFNSIMKFEIPNLYRDLLGDISKPDLFFSDSKEYDQYALLDFIEYIYANCKDISKSEWHRYFKHNHLSFSDTNETANAFKNETNKIFEKTGLLYKLTDKGKIERIIENDALSESIRRNVTEIAEKGLQDLINEAIEKHKSPYPQDNKDAVEKIWDALERLKTYYTALDKKDSVAKIIKNIAGGNTSYIELFDTEFKTLTDIGNNYRIRHHETNRIDITDPRHYDYFFNRCLSLIAMAIQYLQ